MSCSSSTYHHIFAIVVFITFVATCKSLKFFYVKVDLLLFVSLQTKQAVKEIALQLALILLVLANQ